MLLKNMCHHEPEVGNVDSFWPTISQRMDGAPRSEQSPPNGGGNRILEDEAGEGLVFRSSPAMQMLNIPERRAPTGAHQVIAEPPPSHPWRWPLAFIVSTAIVVAGFLYYRQMAVPPPTAEPAALALAPQANTVAAVDESESESAEGDEQGTAATASEEAAGAGTDEAAGASEEKGEPGRAGERARRSGAQVRRGRADQQSQKAEPGKGAQVAAQESPAATDTEAAKKVVPAAGAKATGKKGDELDNLIDSAIGTAPVGQAQKPAASEQPAIDPNEPTQLNIGQIQVGMRKIKGLVQACYDQFQVEGLAKVTVVILGDGSVKDASIKGKFFGTDTGNCVTGAVMKARFPKFSGKPMTIPNYPFHLQ